MEPTLKDGDVLLIRKSDMGVLPETIWAIVTGDTMGGNNVDADQARILRQEQLQGIGGEHAGLSRIYDRPPIALNGHAIVYKNPETAFPTQLCVKRVIGVGGQRVRAASSRQRIQHLIPPYSLYVEGDNRSNSRDSRQIGPISKGLLVGVAEYVLWPPTRIQRIHRVKQQDDLGRPRASWP